MTISASTALYGIFGNPVGHSLSPAMHNAAFLARGVDAVYLAFQPQDAAAAVAAMRAIGMRGASVTIPFKTDMLRLVDSVDPLARDIGSVNTLANHGGVITGYNTDGGGALRALRAAGITVAGSLALVLGNGGSARAIAHALLAEKALVTIAGRSLERVRPLADDLRATHGGVSTALIGDITPEAAARYAIIINTTPVGMTPDTERIPIDAELIRSHHAVFDIVYSPHETRLLRAARDRNARTVHGIEMLLHQGALQFELWTGTPAPLDVMRDALMGALESRASAPR